MLSYLSGHCPGLLNRARVPFLRWAPQGMSGPCRWQRGLAPAHGWGVREEGLAWAPLRSHLLA